MGALLLSHLKGKCFGICAGPRVIGDPTASLSGLMVVTSCQSWGLLGNGTLSFRVAFCVPGAQTRLYLPFIAHSRRLAKVACFLS